MILSSAVALAGCGLALDLDPGDDAATDGAIADAGSGRADGGDPTLDAGDRDAGDRDAGAIDAGAVDAGMPDGGIPPGGDCLDIDDCVTAYGDPPAPCGWSCVTNLCGIACADCADLDRDGHGVGAGCLGPDCDDDDPATTSAGRRACYSGPAGSEGVGSCQAGTEVCVDGAWLPCTGEVGPGPELCNRADDDCNGAVDDATFTVTCGLGACAASASGCTATGAAMCVPALPIAVLDSTCDGMDDDCDGATDEDCPSCIWVSTTGNDASMSPTFASAPFRTIQRAIDFAAADRSGPQRVCVMATSCSSGVTYYNESPSVADGITVQGSYGPGGGRCAALRTGIRATSHSGVLFGNTVRSAELSRMIVAPIRGTSVAGVTLDAARGVTIVDVRVDPGETATIGYGIDARNADFSVIRSAIFAGRGGTEGVGIHAVGSRVQVLGNCDSFDALGRCDRQCVTGSSGLGVYGRTDLGGPGRAARSHAIHLVDSPGSVIRNTATCAHVSGVAASIRLEGDMTGTQVSGNFIAGWGGLTESYGVELMACGGTSAAIFDNYEIYAEAPPGSVQSGVRVHAGCHPAIGGNRRIAAALEGGGDATGVHCGDPGVSTPARCMLFGNVIFGNGNPGSVPTSATGVRCERGSCDRIVGNQITGGQGQRTVGLHVIGGPVFVSRNAIVGGCPRVDSHGAIFDDASGRVENVIFHGGGCVGGTSGGASATYRGAMLIPGSGRGALDLHSSTFFSGGTGTACIARAIEIAAVPGGVPGAIGYLRNDVLALGTCANGIGFHEASPSSDPALVEHCLFDVGGRAAYRDEGTTDLATGALIDALSDGFFSGNVVGPAGFVSTSDFHLASGSMCIGAGTALGMPPLDLDGAVRDPTRPDIGAYRGP